MKLTVQYSAPLPPGFVSGTLELKSRTVYIDKDGNQNQPYYRAAINPDRGLSNFQLPGQQLQIIGMGQGDPANASPLDVVVTMVVIGLPTPLRYPYHVVPIDTGGGNLNLHAPNINLPVVGPLPATIQALLDQFAASNAQIYTATQALTSLLGQTNDAIDLAAFATALIPPAVAEANLATANARAAAATLPCPPVLDATARQAFLAALPGDGSCLQMDTLHVWQKLNGIITDLGPNSLAVGDGTVKSLPATSALTTVQGAVNGDIFSLHGAQYDGDGGGGLWQWVSGQRPPRNGILTEYHATRTDGWYGRIWGGVRANLAWAGLSAAAGATAIAAALAVLAGLWVDVDKTYVLNADLDVPALTSLWGTPSTGFTGNGQIRQLLNLRPGATLHDVNLDGVATAARNTNYSQNGLVRCYGTAQYPNRLVNLFAKNAPDHVVYGSSAHSTRIENLRFDGCNGEAVFFQTSDKLHIDGVFGAHCQHDTVKIHSIDGSNPTFQITSYTIKNIQADYTGVTVTGNTLALEMFGGQTGWLNHGTVENIRVIAPDAIQSGAFWAISADTCRHGSVKSFSVDDRGLKTVTFGIEAAGCVDFTYQTGDIAGYIYLGASISQANSRNVKLLDITFRDAGKDAFATQWVNGANGGEVGGCTYKDAGARYLFMNGAGSSVNAHHNHFLVCQQAVSPDCVYANGVVKNVQLMSNEFGPVVWPGETPSTTACASGGQLPSGAVGWNIAFNTFDPLRPDGTYGGGQMYIYGGSGGHTIAFNKSPGHTDVYIGQYGSGPPSIGVVNTRGDGGTAVALRSSGTVIDLVLTPSPAGVASSGAVNTQYQTGITGGTPLSAVFARGGKATDLHPSMVPELRGEVYLLAADGKYYTGGEVGGFSGLIPGQIVVLREKTSDTDTNLAFIDAGTDTSRYASPTLAYRELGWVKDASTIIWQPGALGISSVAVNTQVDTLAGYVAASTLPADYAELWTADDGNSVRAQARYTNGVALYGVAGTSARRILARQSSPQANGSVLVVSLLSGSGDKMLSVGGRLSGAAGAESGVVAELDPAASTLNIVRYVNGVRTLLKQVNAPTLQENTKYAIELGYFGTRLVARVWATGSARPVWMAATYSPVALGSGRVGAGYRNGELFVGALASTSGLAVLSDLLDVTTI